MLQPRSAFAPVATHASSVLSKRPRCTSPQFPHLTLRPCPFRTRRAFPCPSPIAIPPWSTRHSQSRACADPSETAPPLPVPAAARNPIGPARSPDPPQDAKLTFWAAAFTEAAAAVFAVGLCSLSGLPVLGKGWAFSAGLLAQAALAAVPFSAVFWAIERAPTGIQAATEASFRAFFGKRAVWEVGVFCVCVAFGEELLFRSWLLAGLEKWQLPPYVALVSSSLVFGVLHAYTRVYMILASVAGLMFGGMFLTSGQSVLEPLVVHFLYDFCTILVMQRKWLAGDEL